MLDAIFERQKALIDRLRRERDLVGHDEIVQHPVSRQRMTAQEAMAMDLVRAIQQEAAEALDWLPWKAWKNYEPDSTNWMELDYEFIDLLHFVVQYFADVRGADADYIAFLYEQKNQENHARQDGTVAGREDYKVGE